MDTPLREGLDRVDWRQPWLAPYARLGAALAASVAHGTNVASALNRRTGPSSGIEFIAAAALQPGVPYETQVFATGSVPTRDNLHDFFNGLCWIAFPRSKRRLNQLQAAEIMAKGVGSTRGPVRDAITIFDENAALLQAPEALWQALAARQWQRLFGELRPLWRQANLTLFGHALLEKLVTPHKAITAHVWRVDPTIKCLTDVDAWLANDLAQDKLASKPFVPLPVLGVPGWWAANEDPAFYNDASVFRRTTDSRNSNVPSGANA